MIKIIDIKDKITKDDGFTQNEYLAYLGMSMLLRRNVIMYYVNTEYLGYLLTANYPVNTKLKNSIHNGIIGLSEKQIISPSQSNKNHEWIIDATIMIKEAKINKNETDNNEKYYTSIDEYGIQKILNRDKTDNPNFTQSISLVRFYCYLLSTLHKKDDGYKGAGFEYICKISDDTGYNTKTVSLYLKLLKDLELIYIYKSKDFIKFNDGVIKEISHTYGRFSDKDRIIQIGKKHEEEYGSKLKSAHKKIKKKNNIDNKRKYAQMYYHLEKCIAESKENPYRYEDNKKIYLAMCELNVKYEKERRDRIKDLGMFKEFDFYKG